MSVKITCVEAPVEPERNETSRSDRFALRILQFSARPLALLAEVFFRPCREPVLFAGYCEED